jgi:MerC mercury resistance protein
MFRIFDFSGIVASAICLLHCALTPIALLIPFLSQVPAHDSFHLWMIIIIVLPILLSLVPSFTLHRKVTALVFASSGLICFLLAIFVIGPRHGEIAEAILAGIAGINLIIAHVKNRGYCRSCLQSSRSASKAELT